MSIKITGIGVGLPEKVVTNEELAKIVDTSDQWITTRTGIKQRRVCTTETLTDLAVMGVKQALDRSNTKAEELDFIICATMQGDNVTPSLACIVQREIGASCPGIDINMACCGFLYALEVANNFIKSGNYKKILVVCAEMMSKHMDWTKRDVCVLFGDASAACIVEKGQGLEYINLSCYGDDKYIVQKTGSGNSPFREEQKSQFVQLNGQEVYKFAVSTVQKEIEKGLKTLDIDASKIDNFILHQANLRIVDAVRESLKLPPEKFPVNIEKFGNTSSVSILLLLNDLVTEGRIKKGDKLFMVAFGGGLSSASCVINWEL